MESDNTNYVPYNGKTIALFDPLNPKEGFFIICYGNSENEYYNFKVNTDLYG